MALKVPRIGSLAPTHKPLAMTTLKSRKLLGSALVALQFACMLVLPVLAWADITSGNIPLLALTLAAASLALLGWTLAHNKIGNFNIRPSPKKAGTLVMTGPYRWIRHPMYTAVLLGGASMAVISTSLAGWGVFAFLSLVLLTKANVEERWMCEKYPAYAAYMHASKRLIPWIY